jgi:hypothetical protein
VPSGNKKPGYAGFFIARAGRNPYRRDAGNTGKKPVDDNNASACLPFTGVGRVVVIVIFE